MYYIYRFLDNEGNTLYIGKSTNIIRRINEHFSGNGHLPQDCYINCNSIEILEYENPLEMDIGEIFFINKYKPKYNTISKYKEEYNMNIDIKENWKLFDCELNKKKYNYLLFKETALQNIIIELKELKKQQNEINEKINNIEKTLEEYSKYKIKIPSINGIDGISEQEFLEFNNILNNLYNLTLDESNNNKIYKRISKNDLVINLGEIWDEISKEQDLSKKNFLKLCKKTNIFRGNSREYNKPVNFQGKTKRCYKMNLNDLERFI